MRIERIAKKDEKNVIVYLDNNEKLYLSYEVFLKNGLKKNYEISEDHFSLLVKENQSYHIKQRAWRFLARRMHSVYELRIKLIQKGYNIELISKVLKELEDNNYLNDYTFAAIFAEENIKNKLSGKIKIKSELMKRGVNQEVITRVLKEKFPQGNDIENAIDLVKKKLKVLNSRKLEPKKLQIKLLNYLASKGYDYEISKRAVDKLLGESDEEI